MIEEHFVEWTCLACKQTWLMPMKRRIEKTFEEEKIRAKYCPYCGVKFEEKDVLERLKC